MLVDVHTHLDDKQFLKDLDRVLDRVKNNFIVINNGVDIESNRKTLELAEKYSFIKASLGLHPVDTLKLTDDQVDKEIGYDHGTIVQNCVEVVERIEEGLRS